MEIESSEAIMSNLTPDEKRNLLFDVTCSLEIPMKDFDENWWPLVSNIWTQWNSYKQTNGNIRKDFVCRLMKHRELIDRCKDSPNHTHTLLELDQIKRSQAIRTLVEKNAIKNYSAPAITAAVKEYATKIGLGTSVSELKCKEVANIKYKVRGPMESHLICNSNLNSDILKSITFLTEKGYHLTLIDSTYKTNKYDWRLFTLYVCDTYGCWDVGAHFLVKSSEAIMSNLTPDEKRNLLFDVTCSLEIPMKDFDENWWPLVSNIWTQWNSYKQTNGNIRKDFVCRLMKHRELIDRCKDSPNHTHTLLELDQIKRSQAIRTLVEKNAIKNYSAPAITAAVKEYATKIGLGTSVSELKCKEVANIKYKVRGPMESHLICNSNLNSDILKSITFLTEKGYHLTLIDSTYKTNKYDWRLFTLYVCDTYGCWDVGAHFLVSSEDGDTVFEALKIVRSYCNWIPCYMLSDQSSIEAKGIRKAFPGISAGEQECEVILCVVHVMRIWMTKIYDKKTRNIMNAAMHKRTKIGCEKLIQKAINNCTVPAIRNYIKRNYVKNMQQWALWALS
ncbi:hypothetical protein Glove_143g4 [Diversispora epigaea]|uniref:Uncharacterized protein n=1 Tax=Diversispora epigaea TaxID=1348612 RepID=A0A397J2Y7_9GLOM|nr:hypothetical protein Glove_143g4 [Diversispora epigaea]